MYFLFWKHTVLGLNKPDLFQSFVAGDLYEYYIFILYLEQISANEDHVDTRLRFHRILTTPLLPRPVFTENSRSSYNPLCQVNVT